jgi:DNA-binding NtrC family response regulator
MKREVLVVEDDEIVRDFIVAVLKSAGHGVMTAASVEAARAIIFSRPDVENLGLIIDVVLNHESGIAFAQELIKRYPGFRVLLISGFTDDVLLTEPEDVARMGFMAKPFTSLELIAALDKVWA